MKLVRCVSKGKGEYLTIGKIYKVERQIKQLNQIYIVVVNDRGREHRGVELLFNTTPVNEFTSEVEAIKFSSGEIKVHQPNFIDITEERDQKINRILGYK